MRTLVVAADYPWPINSGSRIRLALTLRALCELGPVDLLSVVSASREDFEPPPPGMALGRVERVAIDDRPPSATEFLTALGRVTLPFEIPRRSRRTVARAWAAAAPHDHDLVWYFRVRAWVLAGAPVSRRAVVDLDDLEDQKILGRLSIPAGPGDPTGGARRHARNLLWREEMRRWRRLHQRIDRCVGATVVCSELDARRADLRGARVVPNGYDATTLPVGRCEVSTPPTVLFQGTLRYPPNADAARFLVEDVGPRLRARVPGARIRLVGLAAARLAALDDPPAVTLVGQVPDITAELAAADVVVVPLRYGGGTRVKVLEAFAQRVPVASTSVGAEGLDVRAGEHLLVGDDAEGLAQACTRLLTDVELRRRVTERAAELFDEHYQAAHVEDAVRAVAQAVAGDPVAAR